MDYTSQPRGSFIRVAPMPKHNMHAKCFADFFLCVLITHITFSVQYKYEAPYYVVFSHLPLLHVFSSASYSHTPSIYVLPLI